VTPRTPNRAERARKHAVVVNVTINDRAAAENELRNELVPWASQAPGFVTG
jgi:hypothetical protein